MKYSAALPLMAILFASPLCAVAEPAARIDLSATASGHPVSPDFYGLMTEEINHAYDGGLYAELVQNRAFNDDPAKPDHWNAVADKGASAAIALDPNGPVNTDALPVSLRIDVNSASDAHRAGVANDGYWGIPARPNTIYRLSFYARASAGFTGDIDADIESADGAQRYAYASVSEIGQAWRQYTVMLKTGSIAASEKNRLVLSVRRPGTIWLSLVSLFPPTYNYRPNGNRIDLMEKMAALKPSFLRLPGGNYLEGVTIANRFPWKRTLGDLSERPGHWGPWGYRSSDGLGLMEFLRWCDDLHMRPLLAIYAGYSLGSEYTSQSGQYVNPGPDLVPYVQDALDEIEFVIGDVHTRWGAERKREGHPAPFPLEYVEIGNEDQFDTRHTYNARFAQFYDAIKAKYPQLKLIATTPVTSRIPDVIDDHYYRSAHDNAVDSTHYDGYPRIGPKIFVGEWASTEGAPTPTMQAALGDAAWLTGLERNSDLVVMESYAPLLVNVNPGAYQWGTNLIGFDGLGSFGSPSYYVQSLFAHYQGDVELPVQVTEPAVTPPAPPIPHGMIGVATWATQSEFTDIHVTHGASELYKSDFAAGDSGWAFPTGSWSVGNGALQQTSNGTPSQAIAGDPSWADYTVTLRARKLSGNEGFLVLFHYENAKNYVQWNLGGWGDTRTAFQRVRDGNTTEIGKSANVTIDTGRWYDIRVEVEGVQIRCYLDGQLISTVNDVPPPPPAPLYVSASRSSKTGAIYVKVVNISANDLPVAIDLSGEPAGGKEYGEVLTGDPSAQNSLDQPLLIAPKGIVRECPNSLFTQTFPAHSVTAFKID